MTAPATFVFADSQVKSIGDALMLRMANGLMRDHGAPAVRVGLHHGAALEREGDYFGAAVSLAARVSGCALSCAGDCARHPERFVRSS